MLVVITISYLASLRCITFETAFAVKFQCLYNGREEVHSIRYVLVRSSNANVMLCIFSLKLKLRYTILISNKSLCTKFSINYMVIKSLIILTFFVTLFYFACTEHLFWLTCLIRRNSFPWVSIGFSTYRNRALLLEVLCLCLFIHHICSNLLSH